MSNTSALSEKHELQRSGKRHLATDQDVVIFLITLATKQTGKNNVSLEYLLQWERWISTNVEFLEKKLGSHLQPLGVTVLPQQHPWYVTWKDDVDTNIE